MKCKLWVGSQPVAGMERRYGRDFKGSHLRVWQRQSESQTSTHWATQRSLRWTRLGHQGGSR